MKKQLLSAIAVCFIIGQLSAQRVLFSISAKGNHSQVGLSIVQPIELTPSSPFFLSSNLDLGTSRPQLGFELGADVRFQVGSQFHLFSGLYFQQIQYKIEQSFLFNFTDPPAFFPIELLEQLGNGSLFGPNDILVFNRRIQYLKLPIGAGIGLFDNKLSFQGGVYGALLINHSETYSRGGDRTLPEDRPIFFTDQNGNLISPPGSETESYNPLLMGLHLGVQYNFVSKLSLTAAYEPSFSSVFKSNVLKEKLNSVSFGLSWQIN